MSRTKWYRDNGGSFISVRDGTALVPQDAFRAAGKFSNTPNANLQRHQATALERLGSLTATARIPRTIRNQHHWEWGLPRVPSKPEDGAWIAVFCEKTSKWCVENSVTRKRVMVGKSCRGRNCHQEAKLEAEKRNLL